MPPSEACLTLRAPLRRADLPGLEARVRHAFEAAPGRTVTLDLAEIPTDAVAVEALCRSKLVAGRGDRRVRLRNGTPELLALVVFMGLTDAIGGELAVEVER